MNTTIVSKALCVGVSVVVSQKLSNEQLDGDYDEHHGGRRTRRRIDSGLSDGQVAHVNVTQRRQTMVRAAVLQVVELHQVRSVYTA